MFGLLGRRRGGEVCHYGCLKWLEEALPRLWNAPEQKSEGWSPFSFGQYGFRLDRSPPSRILVDNEP